MTESTLDGIRLRLDRAEEHLDFLESEIAPYNRRAADTASTEMDQEADWFIVRLRFKEPPPDPALGIITGELIHNLRSALDNLLWQLVLANGGEPSCRNQFPIFTKPSTPRTRRRLATMLSGVSPDHRAIIEELQPNTGTHIHRHVKLALSWLATLSNIDKHRYLHPALAVRDPQAVTRAMIKCSHPITGFRLGDGFLSDGAEVLALRSALEAKVEVEGQAIFEVAIGDPRMTLAVLAGIHERIAGVVERFVPAFS